MATVKVYGYEKCDTCRKAYKFLQARGVNFERVDITQTPPSKAEIERMIGFQKNAFKKLFNISGQAYREGGFAEKMPTLDAAKAASVLAANGRLIKRPFVLLPDRGLVGFKLEEWEAAF